MDFESYAQPVIDFVRVHQAWAAPVVFALCFAESLAFISLLIPAWAALVGIGTLIGASGLNFWPIWIAGSIGAALGDWLSYWVGLKLEKGVYHIWPLSKHPELIPKGENFVKKWGALAIFIGRFSGPLRASVPLVAGSDTVLEHLGRTAERRRRARLVLRDLDRGELGAVERAGMNEIAADGDHCNRHVPAVLLGFRLRGGDRLLGQFESEPRAVHH